MDYEIRAGEALYKAQVESVGGRLYHVSFLDRDRRVDLFEISENLFSMICDDQSYEVDIMEEGNTYNILIKGTSYAVQVLRPGEEPLLPVEEEKGHPPDEEVVVSPMTCTVVKILVRPGETVEDEQEILVTEAMKLEMPIPSPVRGRVKEVLVREGQTVDRGTRLVTLTPLK